MDHFRGQFSRLEGYGVLKTFSRILLSTKSAQTQAYLTAMRFTGFLLVTFFIKSILKSLVILVM